MFPLPQAIESLSATNEEMSEGVIRQALNMAPAYFDKPSDFFEKNRLMEENKILIEENKSLEARLAVLEKEYMQIKQVQSDSTWFEKPISTLGEWCEDDLQLVNVGEPFVVCDDVEEEGLFVSNDKQLQASDMYTRMKENPRNRTDSLLKRTPWTTYSRKKRKTQVILYTPTSSCTSY